LSDRRHRGHHKKRKDGDVDGKDDVTTASLRDAPAKHRWHGDRRQGGGKKKEEEDRVGRPVEDDEEWRRVEEERWRRLELLRGRGNQQQDYPTHEVVGTRYDPPDDGSSSVIKSTKENYNSDKDLLGDSTSYSSRLGDASSYLPADETDLSTASQYPADQVPVSSVGGGDADSAPIEYRHYYHVDSDDYRRLALRSVANKTMGFIILAQYLCRSIPKVLGYASSCTEAVPA
jgi:hypothetical protein